MPGPGNYEEDEVKITGKNFVSKFKSAISGMLGKTRRFPENRGKYGLRKRGLRRLGSTTT